MKTNGTRTFLLRAILFVVLSLYFLVAFAQPDYVFQNGVRIAGTNNQVGAVYRFNNVRPGVDATVTITAITGGITVVELDGASGYPEALQPTLRSNPHTNGYLEMQFQLYVAGTIGTLLPLPYIALEMPVTCIDVDGWEDNDGDGNPLYEFDQVNLGGGFLDFTTFGGEMMFSQSGAWFTGKNTGGIDYPGRDTTAKVVMFTVTNILVSNFRIRVGVDNQSNDQAERLRSVYFRRFTYSHYPLSLPSLTNFQGNRNDNKIMLNWKIASGGEWDQCILERKTDNGEFEQAASFLPTDRAINDYKYNDYVKTSSSYYYRLKIFNKGGEVKYSNTLAFKGGSEQMVQNMKVYPTVAKDMFTVKLNADRSESSGVLQIVDYGGRIVYGKQINLRPGENIFSVNDIANLHGNFVIVVRTGTRIQSQKIIIQ